MGDVELRSKLNQALRNGWIHPSSSHYGSTVLFISHKDWGLRMFMDYCTVNQITKKDRHSLLHIAELVQPLRGSIDFSKIDLASGYHHISKMSNAPRVLVKSPGGFWSMVRYSGSLQEKWYSFGPSWSFHQTSQRLPEH
jgi:hypothetical protein